jgi:hypothetical protein
MSTGFRGTKTFGDLLVRISEPAFKNHGFANHKIGAYWPKILGGKLSKYTVPQKIVFKPGQTTNGVLYIGVANPGLSLEVQANEGLIIERISTFFGYRAIGRIRVSFDPHAANQNDEQQEIDSREVITSSEMKEFEKKIVGIKNNELKETLISLAQSVFKVEGS